MSVGLTVREGLGQFGQGDRVMLVIGRSMAVHLPPGSRMDGSDESLMIGVGLE